jgi:4-amino-4-deoxy-L-arabinose transferase-like glycosyltransferase
MPQRLTLPTILFMLLLLAYLVIGALFAIYTPAWQAPDEPAHYNYIAQLVQDGCCPVIEAGDWDSAYLEALKSNRFAPDLLGNLSSIQYEDHQPPLYYLLGALVYGVSDGSLIALRLYSVALGAGIVLAAYAISLTLLPDIRHVALATAALVAFLPQHIAILASVNNDALGNLMIAITLLATLRYLKGDRVRAWQLGLLVGVGLLTKVSTLFMVGVVGVAILLRLWPGCASLAQWLRAVVREGLAFALPALLLGGLWWARSISVYGFPDLFGLRQHDLVVADQARTADLIAQVGFGQYLSSAVQTTFNSFWGQFGWMGVPMPGWVYTLIMGLLALCLAGYAVSYLISHRGNLAGRPYSPPAPTSDLSLKSPCYRNGEDIWGRGLLILALMLLLAVLAYLYYNTVFLQLQGRYMFTGLIPFALMLACGLDGWVRTARALLPALGRIAASDYLTALPFAAFALLDVYLLWRVIVPALQP